MSYSYKRAKRKKTLGDPTTGGTPAPNMLSPKARPKRVPDSKVNAFKPMQRRYNRG